MQTKIRLALLFGGQSKEHEVSIQSAKAIMERLDLQKYDVFPIEIDQKGSWNCSKHEKDTHFSPCLLRKHFDVIFPILHGPFGEDGTVQGLAELANLPYVGCNLLSSAMCMDKGIMKIMLKEAGLPTVRYALLRSTDSINEKEVLKAFSFPLFIKPANSGSSLGVSKVRVIEEFMPALEEAFHHDETILVEEYIQGREIECAILGNEKPLASLPGEVVSNHEFYSYEAKYLDPNGAEFFLPAKLSDKQTKEVQDLAIAAFKALKCAGMARVDFFLNEKGEFLINEINTLPGFTSISLYPKLWEVTGKSYSRLLDELIELAMERFHRRGNCFK